MKHADVVVAGHLCLDVIPTFPDRGSRFLQDRLFEPGTLIQVGRPVVATGGVVSNVGLALHRLGIPSKLIGKIGDDLFGRAVRQILQDVDVSLADHVVVSGTDTTSYTIVLSPPGVDRIFLHAPGANGTFGPAEVNVDRIEGSRVLHFGYPPIMERTYVDGGVALADLFVDVRRRGTAVSLDMAEIDPNSGAAAVDWTSFLETVLPHVDVFGPSVGEIRYMLGDAGGAAANRGRTGGERGQAHLSGSMPGEEGPPLDAALLIDLADRLLEMGPAVVVLKLGSNGLFLRTSSDRVRLDTVPGLQLDHRWCARTLLHGCFDVHAVGTTGAGDCTLAGLIAAIIKGCPPEECIRMAAAVGACSVEREDAASGVPAWEVVQERIRGGWPQRGIELGLSEWTWSEAARCWVG